MKILKLIRAKLTLQETRSIYDSMNFPKNVDFLGGHFKIGPYLVVISMHFLKVKVQNRKYFWGLLKFQIFLGCLKFLIFFWGGEGGGNGRCWARAYVFRKMRVPPPPPPHPPGGLFLNDTGCYFYR